MADRRRKDVNSLVADEKGHMPTLERIAVAALLDVRDELQAINRRLSCMETLRIPRYLKRIASNTAKPKKRKAA